MIDWQTRATDAAAWVAQHGWPRLRADDPTEATIARWIDAQRRAGRGKAGRRLLPERAAWLDEHLPGWLGTQDRLAIAREVADWITTNRQFPRSSGAPYEEVRLGKWVIRARQRLAHMPAEEAEALDELIPGWRTPRPVGAPRKDRKEQQQQ